MSENGTNGALKVTDVDGRPSLIVYEAMSGVIFHVTPINLPTLRAIQLKAQDLFPYPDKEPFNHPVENAFVEGMTEGAEENPEYIKLCLAVDRERAVWADRAIFDYAAHCPKYPTKDDLIRAFAGQLVRLREIANLPEDDYEAVIFHLVLTWNEPALDDQEHLKVRSSDYSRIIQLAVQTVALTPEEVTAGVRFFRPYVQRDSTRKMAR